MEPTNSAFEARCVGEGITFNDVLLVPGYAQVVPADIGVRFRVSRSVAVNIPVVSAATDTATESRLGLAD